MYSSLKSQLNPSSAILVLGIFLFTFLISLLFSSTTHASGFNASKIINDDVFTNYNSMNTSQIQQFLNQKNSVCLKDFRSQSLVDDNKDGVVQDRSTEAYGRHGTMSAAEIINAAAKIYRINPQVLLVTLQKEQGLITGTNCANIGTALGYGCPDSTPGECDAAAKGFTRQMDYGAYHFRGYFDDTLPSVPFSVGQYNIGYNPNPSCGSSVVNIQNRATASLYSYTPYQPNAYALAGGSDSSFPNCGAFGNRNFYTYMRDWFGSTHNNCSYPGTDGRNIYRLFRPNTNSYLLTTSASEVCAATGSHGYILDGSIGRSVSGGTPVYRLQKNGNYLYTISTSERNSAVQQGFRLEGTAFNARTSLTSEANLPLYRLSYRLTGGYLYTPSTSERGINSQQYNYQYEGVGFYINNTTGNSVNDAFRLSHPTGGYLYTTSTAEKNSAVQNYKYKYEGIGFRTRVGFTADNLPVYRLASNSGYLFTTSFGERKRALQLGYRSEGIVFYAYPTSNLGATQQVYRLAHPNGVYLYTKSTAERDSAVRKFGYRLEGVVFRIP